MRYFVFSFSEYYPSGGLGDIIGKFEHLADATDWVKSYPSEVCSDACYIWDSMADEIVFNLYSE